MDIVLSLANTLTLLDRLQKISSKFKDAELKNILADMHNEIADTKLAAATLKEQIIHLKEKNTVLQKQLSQRTKEKPKIKDECYYFDNDNSRLYCTSCYDKDQKKILTIKNHPKGRLCNVCNSKYNAQINGPIRIVR